MMLDGTFAPGAKQYAVFQEHEYNVDGVYLGPVTIDEDGTPYTSYNTLVYDGNKIYLNRNDSGPDIEKILTTFQNKCQGTTLPVYFCVWIR